MINRSILLRGEKLPEGFEKFCNDLRTESLERDSSKRFSKSGYIIDLIKKDMNEAKTKAHDEKMRKIVEANR